MLNITLLLNALQMIKCAPVCIHKAKVLDSTAVHETMS